MFELLRERMLANIRNNSATVNILQEMVDDSVDPMLGVMEDSLEDDYEDGFEDGDIDPELERIISQIPEDDGDDELTDADLEWVENDEAEPAIEELAESTLFLLN